MGFELNIQNILIALAVLIILMLLRGLRIVQQAEVVIVERLGRYHATLTSGINVIWPFIDRPRTFIRKYKRQVGGSNSLEWIQQETSIIDLRETVYDSLSIIGFTQDNVQIEMSASLYFQITDAVKAVYEVENLPDAIEKLTLTSMRSIVGELTIDQIFRSRDTINQKLRILLDEAADKWGVKINRIELDEVTLPHDVHIASEKQALAERDRRATILQAEGQKRATILQAEGKRDALIAEAQGLRQAEILKAEGQALAISKIIETLQTKNIDPNQHLLAIRYIEALREIMQRDSNKIIYLPYEIHSVLSKVKESFE